MKNHILKLNSWHRNFCLNGLCHHLTETKTSEPSGIYRFVEYIHNIPERHKHSSWIITVIVDLNAITICVIESQIWQVCKGIKCLKMYFPLGQADECIFPSAFTACSRNSPLKLFNSESNFECWLSLPNYLQFFSVWSTNYTDIFSLIIKPIRESI